MNITLSSHSCLSSCSTSTRVLDDWIVDRSTVTVKLSADRNDHCHCRTYVVNTSGRSTVRNATSMNSMKQRCRAKEAHEPHRSVDIIYCSVSVVFGRPWKAHPICLDWSTSISTSSAKVHTSPGFFCNIRPTKTTSA